MMWLLFMAILWNLRFGEVPKGTGVQSSCIFKLEIRACMHVTCRRSFPLLYGDNLSCKHSQQHNNLLKRDHLSIFLAHIYTLTSSKVKVILSGFCSSACDGCLVTFMSPTWMEYTLEDSLGTSSEPGNVEGRNLSKLLNSMCTTGRPECVLSTETRGEYLSHAIYQYPIHI